MVVGVVILAVVGVRRNQTEEVWTVVTNLRSVYGLPPFYIFDWI